MDIRQAFALLSSRSESSDSIRYPNTLVASVDEMLINYTGNSLLLSEDEGRTYPKQLDISNVGIIKYIHLFDNGHVLIADHQKCYYSHDWVTLNESQVFDYDGSVYIPEEYDNFTNYRNSSEKMIIAGQEVACWGNYSTVAGVEYTDKVKVWYTADEGVTVKCCYVFNTPSTIQTRHIHAVDFNKFDSSFWLQTGDNAPDSHWIKGHYDITEDTWNWDIFATGIPFKTTNMVFSENGDVHWSWDIPNGGVVKAGYSTMSDTTTHDRILISDKSCHYVIVSKKGEVVAFQTRDSVTTSLARDFYYSPDGVNFTMIHGEVPSQYAHLDHAQFQTYWGINSKGKILAGVWVDNITHWGRTPSVFVDDFIRKAGFPDAFR